MVLTLFKLTCNTCRAATATIRSGLDRWQDVSVIQEPGILKSRILGLKGAVFSETEGKSRTCIYVPKNMKPYPMHN